ncbi:hypothetical protein CPB85DRAFT_1259501 [Mucidula mucida]|nr:hypothetical protein CPB85DRAFT_1259501 [Mucidula mucida]
MVRKNPRKPGRVPWSMAPRKLLASLKDDEERMTRITVVFGSSAAIKYKIRYGDLPLQDDLEDVPSIPTSDEVAAWEAAEGAGTRCNGTGAAAPDKICLQDSKVLTWYRLEYLGFAKGQQSLTSALTGALKKGTPRKPKQIHVYTNVYWERHNQPEHASAAINAGIDPPPLERLCREELKADEVAVQRGRQASLTKEGDVGYDNKPLVFSMTPPPCSSKECGIVCSILMRLPCEDVDMLYQGDHKGTTLNTGAKGLNAEKVVYGEAEKSLIWLQQTMNNALPVRSRAFLLREQNHLPLPSSDIPSCNCTTTNICSRTTHRHHRHPFARPRHRLLPDHAQDSFICNPELIGPELQAAPENLSTMTAAKLSDYEVTRESNIVRITPLDAPSALAKPSKHRLFSLVAQESDEPLSDDRVDWPCTSLPRRSICSRLSFCASRRRKRQCCPRLTTTTAPTKDDDADADTQRHHDAGDQPDRGSVPSHISPEKAMSRSTSTLIGTNSTARMVAELTNFFGALCRGKDWSNPTWARVVDAFLILKKRSNSSTPKASFGTAALSPGDCNIHEESPNYSKYGAVKTNLDDYGKGWWMWWKSAQPPSCLITRPFSSRTREWGGVRDKIRAKRIRPGFSITTCGARTSMRLFSSAGRLEAAVADVAWTLETHCSDRFFQHATRPPAAKKAPPPKDLLFLSIITVTHCTSRELWWPSFSNTFQTHSGPIEQGGAKSGGAKNAAAGMEKRNWGASNYKSWTTSGK